MRRVRYKQPLWEVKLGDPLDPDEIMTGWKIHQPFLEIPDQVLVCRAIKGNGNDGGYIALSIRDAAYEIDTTGD